MGMLEWRLRWIVHGGYGFWNRNVEGRGLLEFRDEKALCGEYVV